MLEKNKQRNNKMLGRARDPRTNGAWLNKLTESVCLEEDRELIRRARRRIDQKRKRREGREGEERGLRKGAERGYRDREKRVKRDLS